MKILPISLRVILQQRLATMTGILLLAFAPTVLAQAVISTAAGNGAPSFKGGEDSIPGPSAEMHEPSGIALDAFGNLYVTDMLNGAIRKLDTSGLMTTIAGSGETSFSDGDDGPAIDARFKNPIGIDLDATGNIFIADGEADVIRRIDAVTGMITTVAGDGTVGFEGDGGPATAARLDRPTDVTVDGAGNLYIADRNNHRIRKVDVGGTITTFAGSSSVAAFSGDGGQAALAELASPAAVALDGAGNLIFVDAANQRIRSVDTTGIITTIAGNGTASFSGDGGPAALATITRGRGLTVDTAGNIYIGDNGNERVRKIDATGTITTISGTGNPGFSGDYGPPALAEHNRPWDIAVDAAGNIYISDPGNHRVRKIALPTGNSVPTDVAVNPDSAVSSLNPNRPVGALTTTDANGGDSHFYTIAPGLGDTDNNLFTIFTGGTDLRVRNSSSMTGTFSVRVQTDDFNGGVFAKALSVTITDGIAPDVTIVGDNPQLFEAGNPYVELGATANDNIDGDLTASIVTDSSAVDVLTPGNYNVTYDVSDAAGNAAATANRTVTVTPDVTTPVITLTGDNPQLIPTGGAYTELGATATDAVDGDLTAAIVVDSNGVNTAVPGNYTVTYNVMDAASNAATEVTRTVTVTALPDGAPPVITLTGANPQTIQTGNAYAELGATATDDVDGDLTAAIVIDSSAVNTAAAGSYTVTYNVMDAAGNSGTEVTRTVTVQDPPPTPPAPAPSGGGGCTVGPTDGTIDPMLPILMLLSLVYLVRRRFSET